MKVIIRSVLLVLISSAISVNAQVENISLKNPVYTFLKEMKVKNVIPYLTDDIPNLSRYQVKDYLKQIEEKYTTLSETEKKLFERYKIEFYEIIDTANTTYFFNPNEDFSTSLSDAFTNKIKHFYAYADSNAYLFVDLIGNYYYGQQFVPDVNNAQLFDIGFSFRGTVFKHLGYDLTFIKGGAAGSRQVAELIEPRLLQNFKWVENIENIGNYDYTEGYLKYHAEPAKHMNLSIQLGREYKTVGYGYGSKLVFSGDSPSLNFIQFDFNYGIVNFTSIHGSTVGIFYPDVENRYTKYWAFNRLKLSFPKLFEVGIGETIVYSDRGIDISYLTPIAFYKFIEMSLQDRDNGSIYFDFQTNCINNLELQATFLLDENILSNLQNLESYKNKTAYQLGMYWYKAFTINDLSFIVEYTKIRPFVYTHYNIKNNYSAWETNLGHPIGPNADEIFSRLAFNINDWTRIWLDYHFIRSGENVYDSTGTLIKNVGGDIFVTHGYNPENDNAYFLDGIRINNNIFAVDLRIEPIRGFIFDLIYKYNYENNITHGTNRGISYGVINFNLAY